MNKRAGNEFLFTWTNRHPGPPETHLIVSAPSARKFIYMQTSPLRIDWCHLESPQSTPSRPSRFFLIKNPRSRNFQNPSENHDFLWMSGKECFKGILNAANRSGPMSFACIWIFMTFQYFFMKIQGFFIQNQKRVISEDGKKKLCRQRNPLVVPSVCVCVYAN